MSALNKQLVTLLFLNILCAASAQNVLLDSIINIHKRYEFNETLEIFNQIKINKLSDYEKSVFYYEKARHIINTSKDLKESYPLLLNAKKLVHEDSLRLRFDINDELIYSNLSASLSAIAPKELKKENIKIAKQSNDPLHKIICNYYDLSELIENQDSLPTVIERLYESINLAQQIGSKSYENNVKANLALAYSNKENIDSALHYYNLILPYYEQKQDSIRLIANYINLGILHRKNNNYNTSIDYYKKALNLSKADLLGENVSYIKRNLGETYFLAGDSAKSAYHYNDYALLNDSLASIRNMQTLAEFQTKYETAEKEIIIAKEQAANERMQKIIVFLGGLAAVVSLLGLGFYYSQKKKRIIAEQAKSIEKQRADTLLKNQQLIAIDAMISGQEQEREKVAQELHDDLGSTMTTIRLYFENLREAQSVDSSSMFERTSKLLEEAYNKIRNMSHLKNQGVIASKGLIPAVESLANQISKSKQLNVEVIHFGLDKVLDNSFELKIFRIIQELINNVVKHANATQCFINLTSYENELNIMVEDDGKGFHYVPKPNSDGMGLYSIEQRIDHMEGTFQVDSAIGRGTTINIDVPL